MEETPADTDGLELMMCHRRGRMVVGAGHEVVVEGWRVQ